LAMAVAMRGELAGEVILHADRGCQTGRRNTSRLWMPDGPSCGVDDDGDGASGDAFTGVSADS